MNMNPSLLSDELNRRRFVSLAAKSFLGVSILPWASHSFLSGAGLNKPSTQSRTQGKKCNLPLHVGGMTTWIHSIQNQN